MAGVATQFVWVQDPESTLSLGIDEYQVALKAGVQLVMTTMAAQVQSYAQSTHRWSNVTGAAEAGLNAGTIQLTNAIGLFLQHAVYYGIYLELAHGGVWAVISPTLEAYYAKIMAAIQALMR